MLAMCVCVRECMARFCGFSANFVINCVLANANKHVYNVAKAHTEQQQQQQQRRIQFAKSLDRSLNGRAAVAMVAL